MDESEKLMTRKKKMVLMEESEDDDFESFQQEMEAAKTEVTYLESSKTDFSTNMHVSIDNVGCTRMKTQYSYTYRIDGIQVVNWI
ncbi:hypothetical protein AVEN_79824-1 [Araneus ventricosus]|uniref:Uncharacterized protein n=1 Tax=Araneus ventricosus TaxID=182803 RepID=A0A4Y2EZF8_ARAVE|nr:hypothetical protein AVEN_79824-1 [Araneus ventricosus]